MYKFLDGDFKLEEAKLKLQINSTQEEKSMSELFEKVKERYGENILEPNNQIIITGELGEINYSHSMQNKKYYSSVLQVKRLSGTIDKIPLAIVSRYLTRAVGLVGKQVEVKGTLRSRNYYGKELKRHLQVYVDVKEISETDSESENLIFLNAYICKTSVLRTTPKGKEIADVFVSVNRENGHTDYVPCIAWYQKAINIFEMEVGTNIKILGRLQSREYRKLLDEEKGEKETKIAYEVSIFEYEV